MKKPRNPQESQVSQEPQKPSASGRMSGPVDHKTPARSDGTFLDRINLPAMSGDEALRRYDGHLRKYAGQGDNAGSSSAQVSGQKSDSHDPDKDNARRDGASDRQDGAKEHKGHEAASRADLAALAELPLLTRIIGLVGTLGMLVALIVLGLFFAGWVSGL